ncbi:MAG: hypothetical protein KKF89_01960 [Nanoarchaeota archaeon]|nr:hypothetical protein [Nanoarchaeota archaeon]MBU1854460.1 hypothetical protein [Nanoarchaeota archaeon]
MPRHDFSRKSPLSPINRLILDNQEYNLSYKVVTEDMKSLGIGGNPNILTYPYLEWKLLPDSWIVKDANDWGGIWSRKVPSQAFWTVDYMKDKYSTETRFFLACLHDPFYYNTTGIKSVGVCLFYEIYSREHWSEVNSSWRQGGSGLFIPDEKITISRIE